MQYLTIKQSDKLQDISKIVGRQNIDYVLNENSLVRSPNLGKQYYDRCRNYLAEHPELVNPTRIESLLNNLTDNEELFEKACLMDENDWKIFSAFLSFPDAIKIPEFITLPYSSRVLGSTLGGEDVKIGSGVDSIDKSRPVISSPESVSPSTYKQVIKSLRQYGKVDPSIFNHVNTAEHRGFTSKEKAKSSRIPQSVFNLPWGKIQLYSSLLNQTIDIPAYPEEGVETERNANYTNMPDIIYQYEPWTVYQDSGPREQTVEFHLHRDMWSGNHLDGQANKLVRFCEANTFPRYKGSAVLTPTVKLYIEGKVFISGVLTRTRVSWSGPIGRDGWYLELKLGLTIKEVSEVALNIDSVNKMGLIGV